MKSTKQSLAAKLLCIGLFLAAAPHSFAIIRSPYPAKSAPPYRGNMVTIATDASAAAAKHSH
jgi:hypothetical protein